MRLIWLILYFLFLLICNNVLVIALATGVISIIYFIKQYFKFKSFDYIHIWLLAFLYVMVGETLIKYDVIQKTVNGVEAVKLIYISNCLIFIGYYFFNSVKIPIKEKLYIGISKKTIIAVVILAILYFSFNINEAYHSFIFGRHTLLKGNVEVTILSAIGKAFSFIYPAILAYYFRYVKKGKVSIFLLILLCSLVLVVQVLYGTRYNILFSLLGFFMIYYYKNLPLKTIILGLVVVGSVSLYIVKQRPVGKERLKERASIKYDFYKKLGSIGSNENVIKYTAQLLTYYDSKNYEYGKASGFILYWWIPRSIWEGKPKQISYYLLREFSDDRGYYKSRSISFGFTGELYADFGKFSYLIWPFMGAIFSVLDKKRKYHFENKSLKMIIYAMLYPVFFFSVRSWITAMIAFTFILFLFSIFYTYQTHRFMFKKDEGE